MVSSRVLAISDFNARVISVMVAVKSVPELMSYSFRP